ncbi:hypothetical protein [Pedobacter arcticus]|uniref:hypothetical protein n=1 Tax=Pedobacter arcticus TaxID=752140 RepID=UPI00030F8A80|nr:hypothetical protein [Pedobacter arcticus]
MKLILLILFISITQTAFPQSVQRSVLSSQGTSITLPSGLFISQSIGQQGITGGLGAGVYTIQQGYQQNLQSLYSPIVVLNQMTTDVFPKPFKNLVNFKFSEAIISEIMVILLNPVGNVVYQKKFPAPNFLLTVDFGELIPQNYIVKLSAKDYQYSSSLLRI